MKRVVYHRLAASELINSARFYERRNPTLGMALLECVDAMLPKIQRRTELGKPGKFGTRSRRIRRFPFRIVYFEQPERIWIVAIAHFSRRPNYWIGRLQ